MASISGATSSLGNTSLRGVSGMATGIDRDSLIEKMTAGTTAKIQKQKNAMVSLGWKQEACQSISDKILGLQDSYYSYASDSNLKASAFFAKNQITPLGDSDITKFVSATGSSNLLAQLSIRGVKQMATYASRLSDAKGTAGAIDTRLGSDLNACDYATSRLKGTQLKFGDYSGPDNSFRSMGTYTFPSSYKKTVDEDGVKKEITVDIDYTADADKLVAQLNEALEDADFTVGENGKIEFEYDHVSDQIRIKTTNAPSGMLIRETSTALSAMGYHSNNPDGVTLDEFNDPLNKNAFTDSYVHKDNIVDYLKGKKISVTIGGQTKEVELLKEGDSVNSFGGGVLNPDGSTTYDSDSLAGIIQSRLDKAFGTDKIKVDASSGSLQFSAVTKNGDTPNLTITADDADVRQNIGIVKNASNTVSADSSLWDNRTKLGLDSYSSKAALDQALKDGELKINGVTIEGLTSDSTVNQMVDKINNTKNVDVTATYLKDKNQFLLVANETGSGREIQLSAMANEIFGSSNADNNKGGEDAIIEVSYGNGLNSTITSSSNTFDLEGLKVTVNNTFGYRKDEYGNSVLDPSQTVTFNAKANVDGVTEQVKKFIEEYNELIKGINKEVTTKPDKSYGPLTDAQKNEMSETSIENWEKKAKQGLLFNDPTMRELSMSVQNIFTVLMSNGVSPQDLEDIGISISDGWMEGGTIAFDEVKFKSAMETDPEKVSNIFAGGGTVKKGLTQIIEDTFTPYATKYASRNGNSYGRLIEEAGSLKVPSSVSKNQIYRQLEEMQKNVDKLNSQLRSEQDRYISKFSTMETLINQMNAQSSYLSQL